MEIKSWKLELPLNVHGSGAYQMTKGRQMCLGLVLLKSVNHFAHLHSYVMQINTG